MKYLLLTLFTLLLLTAAGRLLAALLIARRKHHGRPPLPRSRQILLSMLMSILLIAAAGFAYLLPYAHAEDTAQSCLSGSWSVTVERTAHGYYFDGPGDSAAILFVPGAKVDAAAYAPLLCSLAENGVDGYLYEPPFHMAFSVSKGAEDALSSYPHARWYAAGHSLGGVTASRYAAGHPDQFDGIILLAAYPASSVPDTLSCCSIYGSLDTKLDLKAYEAHRANFPQQTTEAIIEGGNHAQFGDYGPQRGDSPAAISADAQQKKTAEIILSFLGL